MSDMFLYGRHFSVYPLGGGERQRLSPLRRYIIFAALKAGNLPHYLPR